MKKKIFIFLGIILFSLGLIGIILFSYYNVMVLVENSSPTDDCIDIQIMSDNKILVADSFCYAQFSPNYKMFFVHVPWGEHIVRVKSDTAAIEKCKSFNFTGKRTYIIVEYQYWQIDTLNINKTDTIKTLKTLDKKQFLIGITTKRPSLQ